MEPYLEAANRAVEQRSLGRDSLAADKDKEGHDDRAEEKEPDGGESD